MLPQRCLEAFLDTKGLHSRAQDRLHPMANILQALLSNGDVDLQLVCVELLLDVLQSHADDAKLVEQVRGSAVTAWGGEHRAASLPVSDLDGY